jgi:hypothetical protein
MSKKDREIKIANIEKRQIDGVPHDKKDVEGIKQTIEQIDFGIAMNEKKRQLILTQAQIMAKYPKRLQPTFEYETTKEWLDFASATHLLEGEFKAKDMETDISGLKDRKKILEMQLEEN